MRYLFEPSRVHAGDLASGAVIHSQPGFTAFPVRLGSELFLRAVEVLRAGGAAPPYHLYDPACGGGYLATVLGLVHPELIGRITLSDVSPEALALARRNLRLLSTEGLEERRRELAGLAATTGRPSHADAVEGAARLLARRRGEQVALREVRVFQADLTDAGAVLAQLGDGGVDVALADLPYGRRVQWETAHGGADVPEIQALATLRAAGARVIALATRKGLKLGVPGLQRRAKLSCGHRGLWVFERGPEGGGGRAGD